MFLYKLLFSVLRAKATGVCSSLIFLVFVPFADDCSDRPPPTADQRFLEAYQAGFVSGTLPYMKHSLIPKPRRRFNTLPLRKHASAVEALNVTSAPPAGRAFDDLMRGTLSHVRHSRCSSHFVQSLLLYSSLLDQHFSFSSHPCEHHVRHC